jgi:hypothetical protein
MIVKKRQPVVHARMMAGLADRFVQRIVGRRAELRHVAGAETADGLLVQRHFACRQQFDVGNLVGGKLRLGIETAHRIESGAEEIEAIRFIGARWPQIDDAAAEREIAGLAHRAGAHIAVAGEKPHQPVVVHIVSDPGVKLRLEDSLARRHLLQHGVDVRHHNRRPIVGLAPCECRQCCQACRFDVRLRRHPIVGQAIPGGKIQHRDVRREERQRVQRAAFRRIVGGDEQHQPFAAARGFGRQIRIVATRRAGDGEAALVFGNVVQTIQAGDFRSQTLFNLSNTEEA